MGFFQDLKQDLSQAVTEVSETENVAVVTEAENKEEVSSDKKELHELEAMLEEEISALSEKKEEVKREELVETADVEALLNEVEKHIDEQPAVIETVIEDKTPEKEDTFMSHAAEISSDTAVITAGMTINGDITSSGNMDLVGTIHGNLDILGKLNITGSINGNSSATEVYAESAQINGEIKSKGSVKIGQASVVIGNIFATSAVIAGAVKGDIDVHGPVILDTSAIVMGNIKSKSVQINNGAVIEGMCSQCYAEVSPTTFFNDVKKNRK